MPALAHFSEITKYATIFIKTTFKHSTKVNELEIIY